MLYDTMKRKLARALGIGEPAVFEPVARANEAIQRTRPRANSATQFVSTGEVERVMERGKEWLKTTGVLAKEDIYSYPRANDAGIHREYLPGDALEETASGWSGAPLLLDHPIDEDGIATVIPNGMDEPAHIGEIRSPSVGESESDSMLEAEYWFDLSNEGQHDGHFDAIVEALDNNEVIETSAAYQTNRENETGFHDGQPYNAVQRPILPDHVAAFSPSSGKTGNCSVDSGCGIGRANADSSTDAFVASLDGYVTEDDIGADDPARSIGKRVIEAFGLGGLFGRSNEEGEQESDEPAEPGTGDEDSGMKDTEKIDVLVDEHGFDRENMEPLEGSDCLENIYTKFESSGEEEEQNDTEPEADSGGDADGELAAVANQLSDIQNEMSEMRDELNSQKEDKRDRAAQILAGQSGVDAEFITVSDEKADEIISDAEAGQKTAPRANMAGASGLGVPLPEGDDDDLDAYVASRKSRANGSGGDE